MRETDIVVIIYPSLFFPEAMIILDPFDKEIQYFQVSSIDDIKQILKEHLPWCSQGHDPQIHFGSVQLIEWEHIPVSDIRIRKLEDLENIR